MFTFNLVSKTYGKEEGNLLDEITKEAIAALPTKVTKPAPSASTPRKNVANPSMDNLYNCLLATSHTPSKLDTCTVSNKTKFARYLYTFNQTYLTTSKTSLHD
jgi:hypothetical protein